MTTDSMADLRPGDKTNTMQEVEKIPNRHVAPSEEDPHVAAAEDAKGDGEKMTTSTLVAIFVSLLPSLFHNSTPANAIAVPRVQRSWPNLMRSIDDRIDSDSRHRRHWWRGHRQLGHFGLGDRLCCLFCHCR